VLAVSPASRSHTLVRTLCIVVFVIMIVAVSYATWISISNFSRIGV
jgi:DNA-binding transcriptional regulator of glucitol operon